MTKYLISFDEGAMVFPESELEAVSEATHAVLREAKAAGVWVFGGGLPDAASGAIVDTDGTVHDPAVPAGKETFIGGFCILDLPTRDEALRWAARFAESCRCAQEVREFMDDPES
ncbi:YciI family protein [Curtobacterium pusillum]|uniref:YciI family protein n=1 Tax=Curtobacterium pusillum TaxID=69373 RepID=UPI0011A0E8BC|nr:YciI family protein [Curtobacterium pusillum]